jgi:hypothetical protein
MFLEKYRGPRLLDPGSAPQDVRALWRALSPDQPMPLQFAQAVARAETAGFRTSLTAEEEARRERLLARKVRDARAIPPDVQFQILPTCNISQFFQDHCMNWGRRPNKREACDVFVDPTPANRFVGNASGLGYLYAATCSETATYPFRVQYQNIAGLNWKNVLPPTTVGPGDNIWGQRIATGIPSRFKFRVGFGPASGKFHIMYYADSGFVNPSGVGSYFIELNKPVN